MLTPQYVKELIESANEAKERSTLSLSALHDAIADLGTPSYRAAIVEEHAYLFEPLNEFHFTFDGAALDHQQRMPWQHFKFHEEPERTLLEFRECMRRCIEALGPLPSQSSGTGFSAPIHQLVDAQEAMQRIRRIHMEYIPRYICHALWMRLPIEYGDDVLEQLAGTPYHHLLMSPYPVSISSQDRFSHTHILGGSGQGKTTLIEKLIRDDIDDVEGDARPSIVLVDPHSDLVNRLLRADYVNRMYLTDVPSLSELVYINPRDVAHPLAFNVFGVNRERLAAYDAVGREQVAASVIQTFEYLFNGIMGAQLTPKQGILFRYVARFLLALSEHRGENATVLDMLRLLKDTTPYRDVIATLPETQREFFTGSFNEKIYAQTKEEVSYRLEGLLENPTIARLLTAKENKLDLFTELNSGKLILIDTAKDFLKDGSAIYGRIFISRILQAIMERAAIPEYQRHPTFLYIDEAASFFDRNIDDLLTEARKFKCGVILAHQTLEKASGELRASLAANTAIKLAGGISASDAGAMARDMRTTADFILSQPQHHFAAFIRHKTRKAISIATEPPSAFLPYPEHEFEAMLAENRRRYCAMPETLEEEPSRVYPRAAEADPDTWQ